MDCSEKELDLIQSFERTIGLLRSNLILFLPPLIIAYLIPAALALAGLYLVAPMLILAANSQAPLAALLPGSIVAIAIIIILAVLGYSYVLAGWAEMNRNVTLTGKATFDDFWTGAKAYFRRVLAAILVLALIYIVLVALGIAATFAVLLPLTMSFIQGGLSSITSGAQPSLMQIMAVVANTLGVWLVIATSVGIVFLFTLFWLQSAVLDETGALRALGKSVSFVKNNFVTTLGIVGLYVIATGFTGAIFPGGGGGGGGGALNGAFSFSLVIPPPLEAIFRLLITTFFMLYMFLVYADRKGKLPRKILAKH